MNSRTTIPQFNALTISPRGHPRTLIVVDNNCIHAILVKGQQWFYLLNSWGISEFILFPKSKTKYMCNNQIGDISTLDGTSLKLVDKFTCLGSSVSSTEKDIDTRLTKAWTADNRLSIIWKSDLTDKWNKFSSKQQSYRYCCMDALLGR